jgi:hypothetical protein
VSRYAPPPLAVVSFDRRKGVEFGEPDDDTEQWAYDGPTIKRHLQDWEDSTLRDEASECAHRDGLPPGVTRFILVGRWVGTYDAWNGEHDAWLEDKELVPLERDRELRHMRKTTKPKKEDDARSR